MEKHKNSSTGHEVDQNLQKKERIAMSQGEGRGVSGQDIQCQQSKRDRHAKHSYHHGGHQNNYINGYSFDSNSNPQFTDDHHHDLLSRERSFVRPQSAYNPYTKGGQQIEELHRQRSFHQGQTQQGRDQQFNPRGRKVAGVMPPNQRGGKPAMEIYRPPTLRGPNDFDSNGDVPNVKCQNGVYADNNHYYIRNKRSGLNIHAKEFISGGQPGGGLQHSKSSTHVHIQHGNQGRLQHSKSGHIIKLGSEEGKQQSLSPPRVRFSDVKENINISKPTLVETPSNVPTNAVPCPIKRSKSLGSADLRPLSSNSVPLADIGPFSQDVQTSISKAINDPNALSARLLMEVVRHVFTRVIEASRYSEPTARICIKIIEKEEGETFLETLLNTCQEYFQQRNRLLRNSSTTSSHPGYVTSHPKWIAYMSFLNEMYTQLKRRHVQLMTRRMKNCETAPGLLLLSLLAQCCQICLKEQAVNSLAETECLFFVLTAVGRDIEIEIPQQMARVMSDARDAFITSVRVPAVKKTLLQLIEMHAARWQLPAPAVMYYYPGSGAK